MWIKIERKLESMDLNTTELKFIEDLQYINLDRVDDVVVKEKEIIFHFGENIEHIITSENAKNFVEIKDLINSFEVLKF